MPLMGDLFCSTLPNAARPSKSTCFRMSKPHFGQVQVVVAVVYVVQRRGGNMSVHSVCPSIPDVGLSQGCNRWWLLRLLYHRSGLAVTDTWLCTDVHTWSKTSLWLKRLCRSSHLNVSHARTPSRKQCKRRCSRCVCLRSMRPLKLVGYYGQKPRGRRKSQQLWEHSRYAVLKLALDYRPWNTALKQDIQTNINQYKKVCSSLCPCFVLANTHFARPVP